MKSRLFNASVFLAALVLLAATGLPGAAQQLNARKQSAEQQERKIAELPTQELNPEALRIAVPRECERIRPEVQTHDVPDNFNPPGAPVALSPDLTNWLNVNNVPRKGFDDKRVNMLFADSFRLRSCRICHATLEIQVRHYKDIWTNDSITIGAAPFNSAPGVKLISTGIWTPPGTNPKVLTYALPVGALNNYLMTGPVPPFLDVVTQDDTDVDYAKLSVWYY